MAVYTHSVVLACIKNRRNKASRVGRFKILEQHNHTCSQCGDTCDDFNNLLVGMLGNASLALAELEGTESPLREHLKRIESAAERASDLTRQMLAYSGRGRFVVEPVDLSDVTSVIELASTRLQGRQAVWRDWLASGWKVSAVQATASWAEHGRRRGAERTARPGGAARAPREHLACRPVKYARM